jgi:hypothetical protein
VTNEEILEAAARLLSLLHDATETQWERPPAQHRAKAGGRARGSISDPTAATALDETRLELRAEVQRVACEADRLSAELEQALERFRSVNVHEEAIQRDAQLMGDLD